ncbi:MAG: capsular biosynthesis protein [Thermodesulfobacteriota bacterium]
MKRIVMDVDGTLTLPGSESYAAALPNPPVVTRLREYQAAGFTIVLHTSRNMRTYGNNLGLITARTLPVLLAWLAEHDIPYDEIHLGKPWCGEDGFYVDDRAVRPAEFASLEPDQLRRLLGSEARSEGGRG